MTMKTLARAIIVGLILIVLLTSDLTSQPSLASQKLIPTPGPGRTLPSATTRSHSDGLRQGADGLWYREPVTSGEISTLSAMDVQSTGGPDDYGYTWDDSVAFSWLDATTGAATAIGGTTYAAGPITLPFSFRFYENTYSHIYVSKYGYISFANNVLNDAQGEIPDGSWPNNIIAPYWTPLLVNEGGYTGKVYYVAGGTFPNRYFAVEWYGVRGDYPHDSDSYTFEVILHENGDIVLQYGAMTYGGTGHWCGHAGIEDAFGLDGLPYGSFCQQYPSNRAVRFSRPDPAARVGLPSRRHDGAFTRAGQQQRHSLLIRNTGDLGSDTYDVSISSAWGTAIYAANGTSLLSDTDYDGVPDTGLLTPGEMAGVVVLISTPSTAVLGDSNAAVVTIRSSLDPAKYKAVTIQHAVPAQFGQIYRDWADSFGSLLLASPKGLRTIEGTDYSMGGSDSAVAESPAGNFIQVWEAGYWDGYTHEWSNVRYSIVDPCGSSVRGVTNLTDNRGTTLDTFEYEPVVAVTPDGSTGIAWGRTIVDSSSGTNRYLYNIYFAVLGRSGEVKVAPLALTGNTQWYQSDPPIYGAPRYWKPRISATGDNRFVIAWEGEHQESTGWVSDIYYTVRSSSGSQVKSVTRLTNDTPGNSNLRQPNLAKLNLNRVIITWISGAENNDDLYYAVIGSSGAILKSSTDLSMDETVVDWENYDVVQLANGRIAVFWEAWGCFAGEWVPRIRYALLDSTYNRTGAPTCLAAHPADTEGTACAAATADVAGHAILTWVDDEYHSGNLYYALIDGLGQVTTLPMIFHTGAGSTPSIVTAYGGYSNTSYSTDFARACRNYVPLTLRNYVTMFPGPWELEPNDSSLQANGSLFAGRDYFGHPDEKDYFSFYMREAGTITVDLTNHTGTGVQLQLFYQSTADRKVFDATAPYHLQYTGAPGWYYVYIYSSGGYNTTSPYTLRVTYP